MGFLIRRILSGMHVIDTWWILHEITNLSCVSWPLWENRLMYNSQPFSVFHSRWKKTIAIEVMEVGQSVFIVNKETLNRCSDTRLINGVTHLNNHCLELVGIKPIGIIYKMSQGQKSKFSFITSVISILFNEAKELGKSLKYTRLTPIVHRGSVTRLKPY